MVKKNPITAGINIKCTNPPTVNHRKIVAKLYLKNQESLFIKKSLLIKLIVLLI